jgi:hypothetical protein
MRALTQQEIDICEQPAILAAPIFVLREEIDILPIEGDNVTNFKPPCSGRSGRRGSIKPSSLA